MAMFGVICAAIMYFGAPILATDDIIGALLHGSKSDPRQVAVMRSLSYAVLIILIFRDFQFFRVSCVGIFKVMQI